MVVEICGPGDVTDVIVDGEVVMEGGKVRTLDEKAVPHGGAEGCRRHLEARTGMIQKQTPCIARSGCREQNFLGVHPAEKTR